MKAGEDEVICHGVTCKLVAAKDKRQLLVVAEWMHGRMKCLQLNHATLATPALSSWRGSRMKKLNGKLLNGEQQMGSGNSWFPAGKAAQRHVRHCPTNPQDYHSWDFVIGPQCLCLGATMRAQLLIKAFKGTMTYSQLIYNLAS